jgi:hypothetical protein
MKIIKYIFFINFTTLFILNFIKTSLTIGDIWASIHVNSLIGVQKILESSVIQSKLEISLWYTICYPILELPILLILALLFLMIFTFINIKY